MVKISLAWNGTANLRIEWNEHVIFLDPWFTRNSKANPTIKNTPDTVDDGAVILISHGHFDHLQDIPSILVKKPGTQVYCSETAKQSIKTQVFLRKEIEEGLMLACLDRVHIINAGDVIDLKKQEIKIDVIKSRHAIFDLKTVLKPFFKIEALKKLKEIAKLPRFYPTGDVFGYDVHLGGEARIVLFGSLWSRYTDILKKHAHPDVLVLPIAGRYNSDKIGMKIARIVQPKIIIPVHHDDFYPPISYWTPITALKEGSKNLHPPASFVELPVEKPVTIELNAK